MSLFFLLLDVGHHALVLRSRSNGKIQTGSQLRDEKRSWLAKEPVQITVGSQTTEASKSVPSLHSREGGSQK